MGGIKLAIVIPYYNGNFFLEKLLDSIDHSISHVENTYKLMVYIVDNSMSSGRLEPDKISKYPFVKIIKCRSKIGFGRACNIGSYQAISEGSEYIMILNQDSVLAPTSLNELFIAIGKSKKPKLNIITPIIYNYDFQRIEKLFIQWYLYQSPNLVTDALENREIRQLYPVQLVSGACMVIHSSVIEEYGLFEPLIFMYGEDTLLCENLKIKGITLTIAPRFKIGHAHSNADAEKSKEILQYKRESDFIRLIDSGRIVFAFIFLFKWFLTYGLSLNFTGFRIMTIPFKHPSIFFNFITKKEQLIERINRYIKIDTLQQ